MILGLIALFAAFVAPSAYSQERLIEVRPADFAVAAQGGYGICSCARMTVRLQLAGGTWETRDYVFSTDALFAMSRAEQLMLLREFSAVYQVGAIEALRKGGNVGVAFDGVTFGNDADLGYGEIVRAGAQILAAWLISDSARIDVRAGYELESKRVNLGPRVFEQETRAGTVFRWRGESFEADARLMLGFHPGELNETFHLRGEVGGRYEMLTLSGASLGLGFQGVYENDVERSRYGLRENGYTGLVYVDLELEPIALRGSR